MCTIAIDFDGTISADFDAARIAIKKLKHDGHYIVIWSSRNNPRQHVNQKEVYQEMKDLIHKHEIPYDEIDDGSCGKFHAQVYIDDKCWRFENNWDYLLNRIY